MLFARDALAPGPQACFPPGKRVARVKREAREKFALTALEKESMITP